MAKKGKALGRDPLFWVRNTRKEQPTTSEKGPPDDTPTVSLPGQETEKPAKSEKPKVPEAPLASPQRPDGGGAATSGTQSSRGPAPTGAVGAGPMATPAVPPPPAVQRTAHDFPSRTGLPLSSREISEPRGMFLAVVLAIMLVLLIIGCVAYLQLSGRMGSLENRIQKLENPSGRIVEPGRP